MEEQGSLPDCAWDVDQGVCAIQSCEKVLMSMHKPLLHAPLSNWEQKAQPAELLELENCNAVILRHVPDIRLAKEPL